MIQFTLMSFFVTWKISSKRVSVISRYIITAGAVTALCSTLMGSILPQVHLLQICCLCNFLYIKRSAMFTLQLCVFYTSCQWRNIFVLSGLDIFFRFSNLCGCTVTASNSHGNGERWFVAILFLRCQQKISSSHQEYCDYWNCCCSAGILYGCFPVSRDGESMEPQIHVSPFTWVSMGVMVSFSIFNCLSYLQFYLLSHVLKFGMQMLKR